MESAIEGCLPIANRSELTFTKRMEKTQSDEQLMLQYAKGNALAFEQLYLKHKGGLYRFCLRQLGNKAKAEECFQEIWMKVVNSRESYQPKALFTTFLYRVAQNHIIDTLRKYKKLQQEVELEEGVVALKQNTQSTDIADSLVAADEKHLLRTQIEALPLDQRTAILLKLDGGLSLDEIANVLDCKRETIKSKLRYAMTKLRSSLGETA
ncbi:sigma-70 family RNA polymerase sigma factor [Aliikangiella sp. IMCC44653]